MQIFDAFKNSSPIGKLLQLVGLSFFLTLIFMFISGIVFGRDLTSVNTIRGTQFFQTLGSFLLPAMLVTWIWSGEITKNLYISAFPKFWPSVIVTLIMLLSVPGINMLGELNAKITFPESLSWLELELRTMEDKAALLTEKLLIADSSLIVLLNLLAIAVLPAFAEEFYFRAVIQNLFKKWGKHIAVWLTALIFSAVHMQFFGFLPRMVFGAVFGYFLLWSGNLWYPIIAHFVNNAFVIIAFSKQGVFVDVEIVQTLGTSANYPLIGVLSLVLCASLVFYFRNLFVLQKLKSQTIENSNS